MATSQLYDFGINKVTSNDYYNGREQMYFFKDLNYGLPNNTPYGELPLGTVNVWEEKKIVYPTHNYHPFQPDIFDVVDNTHLVIYSGQDARYLNKDRVSQWFTIDDIIISMNVKMIYGKIKICFVKFRIFRNHNKFHIRISALHIPYGVFPIIFGKK